MASPAPAGAATPGATPESASRNGKAGAGLSALERMNIVVAGHVDHGKSTVIGRLLADTGSLPDGKIEQVQALCRRTARPFEYAFLLDALKDERAQGITIDTARVFFTSSRRHYIIIDAPGHVEFLKNMVSGATRAEAAFLVIDAKEGVRANSRRHGTLMAMLGIRQVAVLVNKMDLVGYDPEVFERLKSEYLEFLHGAGVTPSACIPVSAMAGENIVSAGRAMPWYRGPTALEALDQFRIEPPLVEKPFRMPVQDVYKFTARGDDRRIIAGTVETGVLRPGDEVVFQPSGKRTRVKSIESFNGPARATAGSAAGFTLEDQVYVTRGEIATRAAEPAPAVGTRLAVSLFWLGREPLLVGKDYVLKLGTARTPMRVETIGRVVDATTLTVREESERVARHETAQCVLRLGRVIAFDLVHDVAATGRFVILDDYRISGGGIIREALPEEHGRRTATARLIVVEEPESEFGAVAGRIEARLAEAGQPVYRLSGRREIGRLAPALKAVLDHDVTVLLSVLPGTRAELEPLTSSLDPARIEISWVGPQGGGDSPPR